MITFKSVASATRFLFYALGLYQVTLLADTWPVNSFCPKSILTHSTHGTESCWPDLDHWINSVRTWIHILHRVASQRYDPRHSNQHDATARPAWVLPHRTVACSESSFCFLLPDLPLSVFHNTFPLRDSNCLKNLFCFYHFSTKKLCTHFFFLLFDSHPDSCETARTGRVFSISQMRRLSPWEGRWRV